MAAARCPDHNMQYETSDDADTLAIYGCPDVLGVFVMAEDTL